MIEFLDEHIFGLCGEHFHPNIWFVMVKFTFYHVVTIHYIKCKCGGWFTHKKGCKNLDNSK